MPGHRRELAHGGLNSLAAHGWATVEIFGDEDLQRLAADIASMNVELRVRRNIPDGAAMLTEIRTRHGLSQREFADRLGLDLRTLQNWEQGRNRPDAAAVRLAMLFDQHPDLVEQVAFEPVGLPPA